MNGKLPCDLVRDLFPSYIDKLTSETSDRMIREHLEACEDCRQVLSSMTGDLADPQEEPQESREIDFLRKNRKRNRRIVFGSIAGAVILVLVVLLARLFLIGSGEYTNWAALDLVVDGQTVRFEAVPMDSASAVSRLSFTEENGVVTAQARSVLASPIHTGSLAGSYTAAEPIRQVRIGDRIVWSEGATVSALASELFATRHSYIGDMPANGRVATALNLSAYLGPFTNELETAQEPYGWRLLLSEEVPGAKLAQKEQDMDAFGRVIVGLIENLDHVTFVYTADGEERTRTVTAADATAFFGEDIKNCGKDVRALDALIDKTGLALYAFTGGAAGPQEEIQIRVMNRTDTELMSISSSFYRDGVLRSTAHCQHADNSVIPPGESVWISAAPEDFGGWDESSVLEIEFGFETADGRQVEAHGRFRVTIAPGTPYELALTGSETEGYLIRQ